MTIKILGKDVERGSDYIYIHDIKFLTDNPRVYACTHGERGFKRKPPEEQQKIIYEKLLKEKSVTNLLPEIRRHQGLLDPILVRLDTMAVIEGNSRLAAYRKLAEEDEGRTDDWEYIPCDTVSSLTPEQQAAFLSQIHVKGKTQWSAYEKANFAFVRKDGGWSVKKISELFGESVATIKTRIAVIELMKRNGDAERPHFSYYDVLIRNQDANRLVGDGRLKNVLADIKNLGSNEDDNPFTALEMRRKLPVILQKPKILKRYENEKIDLDEAYQSAKISRAEESVKKATTLLSDISRQEIANLERNELNALKQALRKLRREFDAIQKATDRENRT